ncbi:hypothetical protein ACL2DZ_00655 (plasmid) [Sinorhizobium meliloti]
MVTYFTRFAAPGAAALAALLYVVFPASGNGSDPVPYIGVKGQPACLVDSNADKINRALPLDKAEPNVWPVACERCISHALQIMDPKVVGDILSDGSLGAPAKNEWSLRYLLTQIGGPRGGGSALGDVLESMRIEQSINTFPVGRRPDLETFIIDPWVNAAGALDFRDLVRRLDGKVGVSDDERKDNSDNAWKASPYKLVAIGYRPDLVRLNLEENRITSGGESRFVFQAVSQGVFRAQTLIFEYSLPAANVAELKNWTLDYDSLRSEDLGSADFNNKLLAITKKFTDRNVKFPVPNNVNLGQLRTNELFRPGTFQWELREFHISQRGMLEPSTVQMNPDLMFNTAPENQTLIDYLDSPDFQGSFPNTTIPWTFNGKAFLAGSAITPASFINTRFLPGAAIQPVAEDKIDTWLPTFTDKERRHRFAASTCNGCHGGDAPRTTVFTGKEALLVPLGFFLTGFTHIDGRGGRIGHVGTAIMSDFMCSSDLVARASAFELFRDAQEMLVTNLLDVAREARRQDFKINSLDAMKLVQPQGTLSQSDSSLARFATGLSIIANNQGRVH